MEMDTTTIISIIAIILLIITNILSIALQIKRKKESGEITMDVDDYLTLILEQLDQFASDTIDLTEIKKEDYETEDAWKDAILVFLKDKLIICAEEYGISSNILKLISNEKLDEYLRSAIDLVIYRLSNVNAKTEITDTTTYESEEETKTVKVPESVDIGADINKIMSSDDEFYN